MLYRIMAVIFVLCPQTLLASGVVHCQKAENTLPPMVLSWGIGRVEGQGRISPYRLTLSGRELLINDQSDLAHLRTKIKSATNYELNEVGYWNDADMIQVRLADTQLMRTNLLLSVIKSKDQEGYQGFLSITDLSGLTLEKVFVRCLKE